MKAQAADQSLRVLCSPFNICITPAPLKAIKALTNLQKLSLFELFGSPASSCLTTTKPILAMECPRPEEFLHLAKIGHEGIGNPQDRLELPELVYRALEHLLGWRLEPLNRDAGSEIFFSPRELAPHISEISNLSRALHRNLYPLGVIDSGSFLLMDDAGECFCLHICSPDAYYLGSLRKAIHASLTWEGFRPILPRRDYLQWHGADVYKPNDDQVFWVDCEHWIDPDNRARPEDLRNEQKP